VRILTAVGSPCDLKNDKSNLCEIRQLITPQKQNFIFPVALICLNFKDLLGKQFSNQVVEQAKSKILFNEHESKLGDYTELKRIRVSIRVSLAYSSKISFPAHLILSLFIFSTLTQHTAKTTKNSSK